MKNFRYQADWMQYPNSAKILCVLHVSYKQSLSAAYIPSAYTARHNYLAQIFIKLHYFIFEMAQ